MRQRGKISKLTSQSKKHEILVNTLKDYQRLFYKSEVATIIMGLDGIFLDFNQAALNFYGFTDKAELLNSNPASISPAYQPDGKPSQTKAKELINRVIRDKKVDFEWLHFNKAGDEFLAHVFLEMIKFSNTDCIKVIIKDVSEVDELKRIVDEKTAKLNHLLRFDELTQLYNRRYYMEIIDAHIDTVLRSNLTLSFYFIDIDNFKQYNDCYGHLMGDDVIASIANTIKMGFSRVSDLCFRMGGEEFLVITSTKSVQDAINIADETRESIEQLAIAHRDNPPYNIVTVSIGICSVTNAEKSISASQLLNLADMQLYKAKSLEKNRVCSTLYQADKNL
jgi:diguanylate cyclase (GGDEF)-like protein/PAS domain S-box-containing protein